MIKFKWEKEFKETEIGELPKEWEMTALGDKSKFTIIMGQSPPSKYYNQNGDGIPFIQGKKEFGDLYVKTETYTTKCAKIAPPYSVLITVRAPVGELNITKGRFCIGRGVAAVFNKNRLLLENRFIYYVLKGLNRYLSMLGERGTTYDSITKEELDNFAVPFPKSVERSSIASVLSWFDDLIENKKRQNDILEKTAMAVFKSWFIDFEPFKDSGFVDSELGKIPKTWKVRSIGKIADFRNGLSYKGVEKFSEPTGYLFITLNNVLEGGGFKPEYSWIKSNRIKEHHFLKEGDLIIANTEQTKVGRLVGCPALVTFPYDYKKEKGVYSHHITKITPKDKLYKLFLYLYLKITQQETATFHTGTSVWGLDIENLKRNKLVVIPPKSILERFHNVINPLFKKITINEKQIMVLRKIRDVLLPLLVFGRLRVEEI